MGISREKIVEIEVDFIEKYDGEYILLPITGYFDNTFDNEAFPISKKIIPVFIGIHVISEKIIDRLRTHAQFGPFGCRDLETMKAMRKAGLDAYVSGCLSICRKREVFDEIANRTKVYLIDVPEQFYDVIPQDILNDAINLPSPLQNFGTEEYSPNNTIEAHKFKNSILSEIRDNAKLVITSRLHFSLPLIAMGIPVITLHYCEDDLLECRYSGLDQILSCYTLKNCSLINWNPKVPDIEDIKECTIRLATQMIKNTYEKYSDLCDLSEFYEKSISNIYYTGRTASYVNEMQKKEFILKQGKWDYAKETSWLEFVTNKVIYDTNLVVYGAGDKGKWMLKRYKSYIKQAKTFHLVDSNQLKIGKKMMDLESYTEWCQSTFGSDMIVESPDIIQNLPKENLLVIVAADNYWSGAGISIARTLIEKYDLIEGKHFFMLDKLNNSMNMGLTAASQVNTWYEVL